MPNMSPGMGIVPNSGLVSFSVLLAAEREVPQVEQDRINVDGDHGLAVLPQVKS